LCKFFYQAYRCANHHFPAAAVVSAGQVLDVIFHVVSIPVHDESLLPKSFCHTIGGLSARLLFAGRKCFVGIYTALGQSEPVKAGAAKLTAGLLKEWLWYQFGACCSLRRRELQLSGKYDSGGVLAFW